MPHSIHIHRFLLSLATVLFALILQHAHALAPIPLTTTPNLQLPNNTDIDTGTNLTTIDPNIDPTNTTALGGDPPIKVVAMDATHTVYFTKYQHLFPERNYYAAIVSIQTSLMSQYFQRRVETMFPGNIDFSAFGVRIYLENPTQQLTYAVAHRLFGEVAEFMMQGNFCTARFEMWEIRGGGGWQLGLGWIGPGKSPGEVA